jgi:hypothetical protein
MAELRNDAGVLRFALEIAGRGTPPPGDTGPPGGGRLLAAAGLEYLDRRDGEWWPLLRLPVLYLSQGSARRLLEEAGALLRGTSPGFAWQPDDDPAVGLQLGPAPGGAVVEVGLDLGAFLAEVAGAPRRPEAELALVRFRAAQADLVRFAEALGRELEAEAR